MSTNQLSNSRKRGHKPGNITAQQQVFIKAMQADPGMKPSAAAKVAGYSNPSAAAAKLMKKPHINAELSKQLTSRLERLEMNGDRLLQELAFCALRDPIDLCNEYGEIEISDLSKIPERMRRCIESIEVVERYDREGNPITTTKVKLVPKAPAIEMAMRHFGMFEKDNNQKGKDTLQGVWDKIADQNFDPNTVIIDV